MNLLIRWFVAALALIITAYLLPGVSVSSIYIALIVAVLLGFVNMFLKPIFVILTLPINILTLGLFTFVINGLLFWFVASFVDGFNVVGFGSAILGALIVSVISYFGNMIFDKREDE